MSRKTDLIDSFFEIEALDRDQFLKVKETLTRIGIPARRSDNGKPTLWQTCHVLHKKGRYYICHFKQLFLLDGRSRVTDYTDDDADRTAHIVRLLEEWGLVHSIFEPDGPNINVTVIPYREKANWNLRAKYTLGVHNDREENNQEARFQKDHA